MRARRITLLGMTSLLLKWRADPTDWHSNGTIIGACWTPGCSEDTVIGCFHSFWDFRQTLQWKHDAALTVKQSQSAPLLLRKKSKSLICSLSQKSKSTWELHSVGTQVHLTGYNTGAEPVAVIKNCADAAKNEPWDKYGPSPQTVIL